jgi:hypothetical protein
MSRNVTLSEQSCECDLVTKAAQVILTLLFRAQDKQAVAKNGERVWMKDCGLGDIGQPKNRNAGRMVLSPVDTFSKRQECADADEEEAINY